MTAQLDYNLLEILSECPAPSGREDLVRDLIIKTIAPYCDYCRTDAFGNIIAKKAGRGGTPITLISHMDEVGFIITGTNNLYADFVPLVRMDAEQLVGKKLALSNGDSAIIVKEENGTIKLHPDGTGRATKGMWAVFSQHMALSGSCIQGKAMDDRSGCYALIECMKRCTAPAQDTYYVFTSQEELNGRGSAYFSRRPKHGYYFSVDVSPIRSPDDSQGLVLGKGVGVKVCDGGVTIPERQWSLLTGLADKYDIKWQLDIRNRGTTDVQDLYYLTETSRCFGISIPCHGGHTFCETIDCNDLLHAVQLLQAVLTAGLPAIEGA